MTQIAGFWRISGRHMNCNLPALLSAKGQPMHRALVSVSFIAFSALSILPGCGGDDTQTTSTSSSSSSSSSSSNGGFQPFDICAEQHVRDDHIIVCDKPFDAPPYVHLPPAGGLNDFMV